ncbi:uncharacterized protein LOC100882314 [Megachile rotundata]|uniref:uncharacterized protein LOC100882314 n=1 Tax=Megachile rotundata TaxID=143995 RepID=UPI000614C76C|nr:PREDICTED: tetra-peptide repeat homeobox protein 1-like [Megachile rotundata]
MSAHPALQSSKQRFRHSSPANRTPLRLSTMCTLVAVFLAAVVSVVAAAPSGLLAPGAALAGPILGPAALSGPILGPSALAGPVVGPARLSGAVDGGAVVTGAVAGPSIVSGSVAGHGGWPALAAPAVLPPWGAVLSGPVSPAAALAGPITAPALIAGPSGSIAAGPAGVGGIVRADGHW